MDIAEKIIRDSLKDGLRADSALTIDEWADQFRFLTSDSSAEPGPWRTARTPYLREPMRCLSNTSPWERIVLMFGAQLGKTELGNNWLGYCIDRAPGPFLYVMPTVDMSRDASRTRIEKMIASSPVLRGKVSEPKSRDGGNTLLMKEFQGGFVGMTGANSPSSLSSKPIRYVYLDEIDRFPGDVGGEGDPVNLAVTRTRTFSRRRILLTSTPTISGRSRIEKVYESSDKRRFYVPCPCCGFSQVLKFDNLKWEDKDPTTVWYQCQAKGCKIYNHDKTWMLERGEWQSDLPNYKGRVAGFHLSSLYSPAGWFSWEEIVTMFLESGRNKELLQVFWNTVLGEPWTEIHDGVEWEKLYFRREKYQTGTVPMGGLIITAGADVQNDRLEVVVRAWGRDKENWVVGHYVFLGNTDDLADPCWAKLDALLTKQFPQDSGAMLSIRVLAIDTGGTAGAGMSHTQITYNWCRKYPPTRVMPVKGRSSQAVIVGQPRGVDVLLTNGKKKANALKLWTVGVDIIKAELSGWLRLDQPGEGEPSAPGFCHFPEDLEEEFFKSLCSETLHTTETKTGRKIYEWRKIRPRNEVWDCFVYSRAALSILQVDKYTNREWTRLENAVQGDAREASMVASAVAVNALPVVAPSPAKDPTSKRRGTLSRGVTL